MFTIAFNLSVSHSHWLDMAEILFKRHKTLAQADLSLSCA